MLILIIFFVFSPLFGFQGYSLKIILEPQCENNPELFYNSSCVQNYPEENITKLVYGNMRFVQQQQNDDEKETKSIETTLCDCKPKSISPLVGLNIYGTLRFIVNLNNATYENNYFTYIQSFDSCTKNLTLKDECNRACYDIKPKDSNLESICLPKYQTVILLAVNDELDELILDEFYVNFLYVCAFVPKDKHVKLCHPAF